MDNFGLGEGALDALYLLPDVVGIAENAFCGELGDGFGEIVDGFDELEDSMEHFSTVDVVARFLGFLCQELMVGVEREGGVVGDIFLGGIGLAEFHFGSFSCQ